MLSEIIGFVLVQRVKATQMNVESSLEAQVVGDNMRGDLVEKAITV
jgi:hypothetical protein